MKHNCKIYCPGKFGLVLATLAFYFALSLNLFAVEGFYISPGTIVNFNQNTTVYIGNDLTIGNGAYLTQQSNGKVYLTGNFTNNGGFFSTIATFIMNGITDQAIGGTTSSEFHILSINKTTGQIELNYPGKIKSSLRLISTNAIFDLNSNDLTLAPAAKVYSDDGTTEAINSFSSTKSIMNSGSGSDPLAGASLIHEIKPDSALPIDLLFPISTPGTYSSVKITLLNGGATFGANPQVKVKPVPLEHPKVETINASQKKYYVVKSQDVTVNPQGISISGYPDAADGNNFGNYLPLVYAPNYNDPTGYWRINPGVTNLVKFASPNDWYSNQSSVLNGDWLIGERRAAEATYYARNNGDWNDPNTWSKVDFDGVASTTAPNKRSDKVRIQNHTVTITGAIADASLISVETGTSGRTSGILKISGENVCKGDTFKLETGTRLYIAHTQGISDATGSAGAIQTLSRSFNSNAIYYFWEGQNQITGIGLPTTVRTIVVDKTAGSAVSLSQNTSISDSLLIVEGVLDLASSSLNGQSSNRTLKMLGGELIIRNSFPINYTPPTFNFGQVTFDGTSSVIPSSVAGSSPAVLQYNKLFVKGTRSSNITIEPSGEIKLIGDLDVSGLSFSNNTFGFTTSGSTVRFAKNSGNQNVNFTPLSPIDDACNMKFHKLILDSAGTKTITGSNPATLKILNDLTIRDSANFVSNNFDIEVQGNWINQTGAKFTPTAGKSVTMNSVLPSPQTITIQSRDTTDNAFQNLIIKGIGAVRPINNLKVLGNITLESGSTFKADTIFNIFLFGNWTNNGGTLVQSMSSTIYFQGAATQFISNTANTNEQFSNLVLRNPANLNSNSIGNDTTKGLIITRNLDLNYGRIDARNRYVQVDNNITRGLGGGYINSRLRRYIVKVNDSERLFEIGYENSYTPVTIKFLQDAITQSGYLQIFSDTITTTTTPVSWSDATPTAVLPAGSKLSPGKHIARQWTIAKPTGSTLQIAANGKLNITPHFRIQDLRNGMNTNLCDASLYNGSPWIYPRYYTPLEPEILNRTIDSITFAKSQHFGTLVVGEPATLAFYSRGNGNWNIDTNWSINYYNGPIAPEFPGKLRQNYAAYIGASREITLDQNRTVSDSLGVTYHGLVVVDSSGVLNFGTNYLSGTGEFRMLKNSTIKMQDTAGITTILTATGNVRTSTRNYNYNSHNSGAFIYNRNGNQLCGNGLPSGSDSVNVIVADNNGGTLRLNANGNVNIRDSLYIKSSILNSFNNNISLAGNFRLETGTSYVHNNRKFSFTGTKLLQEVSAKSTFTFYDLFINKNQIFSVVRFLPTATGNSLNIQIIDSLKFEVNNKAYISLSPSYTADWYPDYNKGEWYLTIVNPTATLTRSGLGHIDGELRKWVPSGNLAGAGIQFEVGASIFYRTFLFDLNGNNGTPGYVGVQSIPNLHHYAGYLDNIDFNLPLERMIKNYWRITTPKIAPFAQGNNRGMTMRVSYVNPDDIPPGALIYCFDLAFWRGGNQNNWQRLNPPDNSFNDGSNSNCGDRNANAGDAEYQPTLIATPTSTVTYNIDRALRFTNTDLNLDTNRRYLLADVVIGQQGPDLVHFYSRKSGNWTDTTVWSTVDYGVPINTINSYPRERLHVANIGAGHKVTLNANLGNGWPDSGVEFREQRLGSVIVEETPGGKGHLDLGTFVIRASVFELRNGGILETGCNEGFPLAKNRGNIIQQSIYDSLARDFNVNNHNNGNYIYNPEGLISTNLSGDYRYCQPELGTSGRYISRVRASLGNTFDAGNVIGDFSDGSNSTNGQRYFPYDVFRLTAGQTYTFRIDIGSSGSGYTGNIYLDSNFNGTFSTTERMSNGTISGNSIDLTYKVADSTRQGTTQLRVIAMNSNANEPCPTNNRTGEAEDYTVYISNPNSTIVQNTGGAVPAQIASLTINADSCGKYVEQNSDISVKDSILIKAGQFSTSTYSMKLQGDFVNNADTSGLRSDVGGIEFNGTANQQIRGTSATKMWNTILNNTGKSIILKQELTNRNLMTFQQDCKLDIEEKNLYFDTTAQMISSGSGSFSKNRMITSLGTTSSHSITKYFPSTSGASAIKEFLFPIGYSTNYNPVYMKDTISAYALKPAINSKIVGAKHPDLPPPSVNYLNAYWPVTSSNFNNIDVLKFYYQPSDVVQDSLKFIPAVFAGGNWRYDVGDNPSASPSPILITKTTRINGDWAVIDSTIQTFGTIYYSRANGDWSNPNSWSTDQVLKHSGPPTSFYPGEIFNADTVNIDGHTITFDILSAKIDTLQIGGSGGPIGDGVLTFNSILNGKKLTSRIINLTSDNGNINVLSGSAITDTIEIYTDLINNSSNGINGLVGTHSLNFKYIGNENSNISGNGKWLNVEGIIVQKYDGWLDSVKINSLMFSRGTNLSTNPRFTMNNGILVSNSDTLTKLSGESHIVEIKPYAGLIARRGDFQTNSHLRNYPSSLIRLDSSNIYVGNHSDENYIYDTGTDFQLVAGKFIVGGAFIPQNDVSLLNLSLDLLGEITAGRYGYSGTRPTFDMSNSGSAISMTGGRIILANGNINSVSNLTINAANPIGTGITGGTIQIGDSTLTTFPTLFKFGGITPLYNLHLVSSSPSTTYTSTLSTSKTIVKNQIFIDTKQILDLNGKILVLQGDLLSYGKLSGTPSATTSDPWQIQLTGDSIQYFKNFNSTENYFEVFNLTIDKNGGEIILGGSDAGIQTSSIKVNENLDFTDDNLSFINAQTFSNKVILGPNSSSLGQYQVIRSGLGHVFGTMSKFVPSGNQTPFYAVGADTLESYRPVELEITGGSNTAGYLDVTHRNVMHPDVANSKLVPDSTLSMYWIVRPSSTSPFALGVNGKYSITTYFLNPEDIPANSNPAYYEHSLCSPSYVPPPPGTWYSPIFAARTDTTVKSRDEIKWGDYIVGNPITTTFWSIADGNWENMNTWSLSGYEIPNIPTRIPNQPNDIIKIGNGKSVFLNEGLYPAIKSVIIEKYNDLPGILLINGASNYISGESFTLNDSCSLAIQNQQGIDASDPFGAVRTTFRDFGISRYIYNSTNGNQITGDGLPLNVQSLIITNSSSGTDKTVTISNPLGNPINVKELLHIEQGILNSGNRNINLLGDFILEDMTNDGLFQPLTAKVSFDGIASSNNVIMKNKVGLATYDVDIVGGNVLVSRNGPGITSATHHYVQNNLNFLSAGKIILGDATNLIVTNPNANAITNYGNDRFIQTSQTSGMLIRSVNSTGNYVYPIGSNESSTDHYTPMNLNVQTLTSSSKFGVRVSPGANPSFPGGHAFVRTVATSEYLKRFWLIDSVSGDFVGTGRFYYNDNDILGVEANYNRLGRWRPQNEGSPGAWYEWTNPPIDIANNYFETFGNFSSNEFTGDWTLGNPFAFRRIFFSRQTGNWSDPNSWTENSTHNGPILGAGEWPNAVSDSVQIGEYGGNRHEITLDVDATIKGTSLGTNSLNRGIFNTNFHTIQGEYFTMSELSHLKVTSPDGISALPALTGNIRSTDTRTFSTNGIYEYNGNVNQAIGSALPATLNTLIVNNSGSDPANIVTVDKNLSITKDLTITRGALDLRTFTANNTGTGNFTNSSLGRIIIGGSNNMQTSVNNYLSYSIDVDSYTEFNSLLDQQISDMPANLNLDFGLGNVDLNGGGTKKVSQFNSKQMIIRGNLRNFSPARLEVMPVDNTIWIFKDIINKSHIKNDGVIDLGEK